MSSLFPENSPYPQGFELISDFITPDEETKLLETVSDIPLHPFVFQGFEAKRKVASFGYDYHFDSKHLKKGQEIPAGLAPLIKKVSQQLNTAPGLFKEVLVTEYPPGAVINWHRDAPPFDVIAGISLGSGCIFRLRPYTKGTRDPKAVISFPVGRRSLYIISGEAREQWEHSISPVRTTRFSITLRTLR